MDIYTLEAGLKSYIVSGVRKRKSKKSGVYRPINILNFVAYAGDKSKLYRIKESSLRHVFTSLPTNVVKSSMAMFMLDLCRCSIRETEVNEELYYFITNAIIELDKSPSVNPLYHIFFTMQLTKYLGFLPGNNWSKETPIFHMEEGNFIEHSMGGVSELSEEQSMYFDQLLNANFEVEIPKQMRSILLDKLILYYRIHVSGFQEVKSLEVCKTIFS